MAAFEIVDGNIVIKNFQETRDELRVDWKKVFDGIDLSPTSVDGHHVDLEARTVTSCMQALQSVVTNLDRRYAEGERLDILAAFLGIKRLDALAASPTVVFHGVAGTVIPAGTLVTFESSPYNFSLDNDVTLNSSGVGQGTCTCGGYVGKVQLYVGDWILVNNTPQGVTCECLTQSGAGRDRETDAELRARMDAVSYSEGFATYDAMLTYLRNKISTSCTLAVNPEPLTANGLPPHSFRVTVPQGAGPSADEIAQAIFDCKPAGIKSSGNNSGTAVSAITGQSFTEYFSVPSSVSLYVKVNLTRYDEEVFPDNGAELIKDAIVEWAKSEYFAGKDAIAIRYVVPVSSVPGILGIEVLLSEDGSVWANSYIAINADECAVVERQNIKVTMGS